MNALKCARLQQEALRLLENHPEIGNLNGAELTTVLTSAAGTVTACLAGAAMATRVASILAGED